jgi:glutathione S-transferase
MYEFVLHGIPASPYVRAAALGLEEKGADYRIAAMAPRDEKSPAYLKRHPFGRVPLLAHGDFELYETQAILRYVDRIVTGPPLTPREAKAEARMNQICGITDWYVMPHVTIGITFDRLVAPRLGLPVDEAKITASIPRAATCIAEIARLLGDRPFVTGESLSLADLLLAPHLVFFACTPESAAILEPQRALRAWIERMTARPSFQATMPEILAAKAA